MDAEKSKKKRKDIKIVMVMGPDGQLVEKRLKRKAKKPVASVPNASDRQDFDLA